MTTHDLLDDVIIRLARCDRVELQAVSAFVHGIETARNGSVVLDLSEIEDVTADPYDAIEIEWLDRYDYEGGAG